MFTNWVVVDIALPRNPCDHLYGRTFAFICFLLSVKLENWLESKGLIERHNLTFVYKWNCPGPSGQQLTLGVGE